MTSTPSIQTTPALSSDQRIALTDGTGDFFPRHASQAEDGAMTWPDQAFFGYLVGDRTPIHNADTLACALLARIVHRTAHEDIRTAAEAGLRWTIGHQRPDGSGLYGEQSHIRWVDNFHTGYVQDSGPLSSHVIFRGRHTEVLPNSVYPIDGQCVAQAIQIMTLGQHSATHPSMATPIMEALCWLQHNSRAVS